MFLSKRIDKIIKKKYMPINKVQNKICLIKQIDRSHVHKAIIYYNLCASPNEIIGPIPKRDNPTNELTRKKLMVGETYSAGICGQHTGIVAAGLL
jgi:hypothetical protein